MKPGVLVFLAGPVFPTDVRNLRCSELGGLRCAQLLNLTIEGPKKTSMGYNFPQTHDFFTGWHGYITGLARVEHGLVNATSQTQTFPDWVKTIPLWGR